MSQETHLFSVRRPRETLGGINHNASALPVPTSAMKRSNSTSTSQQPPSTVGHVRSVSGSRMSLAPGRPNQPMFQRTSSGTNLADMGTATAPRPSSVNMFGSAGGRKSFAPVTPAHAAPLQLQQPNTQQRRSSIYSARQSNSVGQYGVQSFFTQAPIPAGVPRDPRPLKDRNFQAMIGQELLDYLTQNNFEMDMKHSLTQNTMKSPTQKDFNYMFQWLYCRIDPSYKFLKSIDAEVPPILKQLRYPFEKSITKSQLTAVGGHTWPTFLGVLHWMMQLARMMDAYRNGSYDDASVEAGHDVSGDRIVFDFLMDAYHEWLAMDDDQDDRVDEILKPHVNAMAAKFDEAGSKYLEQAKMLEAEHKSLQKQIDDLSKTAPRIGQLNEDIKILEEDRGKFEAYNRSIEAKIEKYEGRANLLSDEIRKIEEELEDAENERAELQRAVDRQGISIRDIDRLNTERERLQRSSELTAIRLEESRNKSIEKEAEANSRLDGLERTVQEYNALGYQIGVIPSTAVNAKGHNYELKLTVNAQPDFSSSRSRRKSANQDQERLLADSQNGYQPQHLLNLDVKGLVKANLVTLRKEISERKNRAAEEDMRNKDMLDQVREAIEDREQEVEGLRHRVRAAEEEYEKTREITNLQKMESDAQIEKLEKELARMRATVTESVQLMEQREMNTNIEYEQLTVKAAELREQLHTEVERILNDVIKFKVHIQKSLEDYEGFVADEVEREFTEAEEEEQEERELDG